MALIGITGTKGSGKGVIADHLNNAWDFQTIKFAQALKDMLMVFGLTPAQIEGVEKEVPTDLLQGKTPREAMQTLGTEWGRDLIGDSVWTEVWKSRVVCAHHNAMHFNAVADDVRFQNEADAILSLGGVVWRVERPVKTAEDMVLPDLHKSEMELKTIETALTITNDGTIEDLQKKVNQAIHLHIHPGHEC